jgi:tetratricopeptide (TPR) repeat protein
LVSILTLFTIILFSPSVFAGQAITTNNKPINLEPQTIGDYNNRGVAYSKKDQYNLAITDFNKAIELNPQWAEGYYESYYEKAYSLGHLGKNKAAIDCFYKFLQYAKADNPRREQAKQQIIELGGTI